MSDIQDIIGYETAEALAETDYMGTYQPLSGGVRRNKKVFLSVLRTYFQKFASFTEGNVLKFSSLGVPSDSGFSIDQDLNTDSDVQFNSLTTGAIEATTLNTGQGAFELGQNVRTSDDVEFNSVNTGQGVNELYGMDQGVKTTDDVKFNKVSTDTIVEKTTGHRIAFDSIISPQKGIRPLSIRSFSGVSTGATWLSSLSSDLKIGEVYFSPGGIRRVSSGENFTVSSMYLLDAATLEIYTQNDTSGEPETLMFTPANTDVYRGRISY